MIKTVTWNRAEDDVCVMCGADLISPKDAVMSMCSACLDITKESAQKQIKNRKNRTGSVRRMKLKVTVV